MIDHFTNFDYAVVGIMLLSCLFAFFRGLVREVLSLIAWIGAGLITIYYFPSVAEKLQSHFKSPIVAATVATVGLYLTALICFALINMMIIKTIKRGEEAGMLDNLLGLLFGSLRGTLIVSLGYLLLMAVMPTGGEPPQWLADSVTRPYAAMGADMLSKAAPHYMEELTSLEKKAADDVQSVRKTAPVDNEQPEENGSGYSKKSNQQLDRLIDSTGPAR